MRRTVDYFNFIVIIIFLFFYSCKADIKQSKIEDSIKVTEIKVINSVYCSPYPLLKKQVMIYDEARIISILDMIIHSEQIPTNSVYIKINYGFFEMFYKIDQTEYSYMILYSIYDGIIIIDNKNGNMFKNDKLEKLIINLFL